MRIVTFVIASVFAVASTALSAAEPMRLEAPDIAALQKLKPGETHLVRHAPVGKNIAGGVRLQRIDVYAPDAKVYVIDEKGQREIPRSNWLAFVSDANEAGSARLSIAMSPDAKEVQGVLTGDDGSAYAVQGKLANGALQLSTVDDSSKAIEGTRTCALGDTTVPTHSMPRAAGRKAANPNAPAGGTHNAVVAVDTDNEFMSLRFANNPTPTNNYLVSLFAALNVIYQRDFNINLVMGTTFLRTSADPYASTTATPINDQLDEMGEVWLMSHTGVQRAFAMQLSGKLAAGPAGGFSGIAWLMDNSIYCDQTGFNFPGCSDGTCTAGTFSVNRTWTNQTTLASFEPVVIGHEIGHNFGASHTHCSSAITGAGDVSTGTIDTCFNGEGGCYAAATSCPAPATINGVPNVRGTIMSYCHLLGGCNSSGVFANAHRTRLTPFVAANILDGCFALAGGPGETPIFRNGFE